jgi:hypothetical protein
MFNECSAMSRTQSIHFGVSTNTDCVCSEMPPSIIKRLAFVRRRPQDDAGGGHVTETLPSGRTDTVSLPPEPMLSCSSRRVQILRLDTCLLISTLRVKKVVRKQTLLMCSLLFYKNSGHRTIRNSDLAVYRSSATGFLEPSVMLGGIHRVSFSIGPFYT